MSFDLDKLFATGSQLAGSAKKTASVLAYKGKIRMDLMNAQARLNKAQRQLGSLVYSLVKNGEENRDLVQKYVDAIDRIQLEIAQLKEQMAAAQTQQNAAPATTSYVYEYTEEEQEETEHRHCHQCGNEVQEDALFCDRCGAQL